MLRPTYRPKLFVQMGDSVTEAGATSAAAAFFRQELNACTWTEKVIDFDDDTFGLHKTHGCHDAFRGRYLDNHGAAAIQNDFDVNLKAQTRLRFEIPIRPRPHLRRQGSDDDDGERSSSSPSSLRRPREPMIELVVSRAAGPAFSSLESALAAQAATLLGQAVSRIRVVSMLKETEVALQGALRGMEEASVAVSALIDERENRNKLEDQRSDEYEEYLRAASAKEELARVVAGGVQQLQAGEQGMEQQRAMHKEARRVAAAEAELEHRQSRDEVTALCRKVPGEQAELKEQIAQREVESKEAMAGAMLTTEQVLRKAEEREGEVGYTQTDTSTLRSRLAEVGEAVAAVMAVAAHLCRAAAEVQRGNRDVAAADANARGAALFPPNAEQDRLMGMVTSVACTALQCSLARVERNAAALVGAGVDGEAAVDEDLPTAIKPKNLGAAAWREIATDDQFSLALRLTPSSQHCGGCNLEGLTLSLRSGRTDGFTTEDRLFASGLAHCLGSALFALRAQTRAWDYEPTPGGAASNANTRSDGVAGNSDAVATAAAGSPAIEEGKEQGGRTASLRVKTQASADAAADAMRREDMGASAKESCATAGAERQVKALLHLLMEFHTAVRTVGEEVATEHHTAAVANAVAKRAADAIPGCVDAALLLAPRAKTDDRAFGGQGRDGESKSTDTATTFAHKWACRFPLGFVETEESPAGATQQKQRRLVGSTTSRPVETHVRTAKQRWVAAAEKSALQAANTGKIVCIRAIDTGVNRAALKSTGIICFSPVLSLSSLSRREPDSRTTRPKRKHVRAKSRQNGEAEGNDARRDEWAREPRPSGGNSARGSDGKGPEETSAVLAFSLQLGGSSSCADSGGCLMELSPAGSVHDGATLGVPSTSPQTLGKVSRAIAGVTHAVTLTLSALAIKRNRCIPSTDDDGLTTQCSPPRALEQQPPRAAGKFRNDLGTPQSAETPGKAAVTSKQTRAEQRGPSPADLTHGQASTVAQRTDQPDLLAVQLAKLVRILERKVGGLRAPEARASTALAGAKADAMALRGELQLAALERDRLIRRLNDKQGEFSEKIGPEGGNLGVGISAMGQKPGGEGGRLEGMRSRRAGETLAGGSVEVGLGSRVRMMSPEVNSDAPRIAMLGVGHDESRNTATATAVERLLQSEGRGLRGDGASSVLGAGAAAIGSRVRSPGLSGSVGIHRFDSCSAAAFDVLRSTSSAASSALQNMASVHARLSASLRKEGLSIA